MTLYYLWLWIAKCKKYALADSNASDIARRAKCLQSYKAIHLLTKIQISKCMPPMRCHNNTKKPNINKSKENDNKFNGMDDRST